jgi:hypothetical protein
MVGSVARNNSTKHWTCKRSLCPCSNTTKVLMATRPPGGVSSVRFDARNVRVDRAAASKVSISKPPDPRLRVQRFVRRCVSQLAPHQATPNILSGVFARSLPPRTLPQIRGTEICICSIWLVRRTPITPEETTRMQSPTRDIPESNRSGAHNRIRHQESKVSIEVSKVQFPLNLS